MTITQDYLKRLFKLGDGDLYWDVVHGSNSITTIGDKAGWIHASGYREIGIDGKTYKAHRLIFLMKNGYLPDMVDHINGDISDNRPENLRPCTGAENQHNRKVRHDSKSGLKCVIWSKNDSKWQVRISANGKRHFLGLFDTIFEAACVVIPARERLHGDFCNHGLRGQ